MKAITNIPYLTNEAAIRTILWAIKDCEKAVTSNEQAGNFSTTTQFREALAGLNKIHEGLTADTVKGNADKAKALDATCASIPQLNL